MQSTPVPRQRAARARASFSVSCLHWLFDPAHRRRVRAARETGRPVLGNCARKPPATLWSVLGIYPSSVLSWVGLVVGIALFVPMSRLSLCCVRFVADTLNIADWEKMATPNRKIVFLPAVGSQHLPSSTAHTTPVLVVCIGAAPPRTIVCTVAGFGTPRRRALNGGHIVKG